MPEGITEEGCSAAWQHLNPLQCRPQECVHHKGGCGCAGQPAPGREGLQAREVALHMRLVEAHIARAGHGAPHNLLQRVCEATFLQFLLLCSLCIHIQPHPCTSKLGRQAEDAFKSDAFVRDVGQSIPERLPGCLVTRAPASCSFIRSQLRLCKGVRFPGTQEKTPVQMPRTCCCMASVLTQHLDVLG